MEIITEANFIGQVFLNMREVLLTNSNSYPVSSSYSKNSTIPIIIIEATVNPIRGHYGNDGEQTKSALVEIISYGKTKLQSETLAQECFTLIKSSSVEEYKMSIKDYRVFPSQEDVSDSTRLHKTSIVYNITLD